MAKLNAALLLFLSLAALDARAAWIEKGLNDENSPGPDLVHRYFVVENSETGERASVELALFPTKLFTLRVIDQPAEPRNYLAEVMRRERCLAGVNGGYFDPDYRAIGLLIVDGKMIAPLQRARLLSGILAASQRGIQIVRVAEFSRKQKLQAAVQCGPFLVDSGNRVPGLEATRSARRTFAAIGSGHRAAVGFCSDVTLDDLGRILASSGGDFKVQRALNLDGGSSSAFWFKRKTGAPFSVPERKAVRDFVAVVPR